MTTTPAESESFTIHGLYKETPSESLLPIDNKSPQREGSKERSAEKMTEQSLETGFTKLCFNDDLNIEKFRIHTERRELMKKNVDRHQNSLVQVNSTLAMGAEGSELYA